MNRRREWLLVLLVLLGFVLTCVATAVAVAFYGLDYSGPGFAASAWYDPDMRGLTSHAEIEDGRLEMAVVRVGQCVWEVRVGEWKR